MRETFYILFGAAFTIAVSTALGSLLLARLRIALYRTEAALIAFVAGAGCLSFVTALLCTVHLARKGVFQWLGAGVIALAVWTARKAPRRRELPAVPLTWWAGFFAVFAIFGIYYFINALAPEVSPDGSGYHLGNVARMTRSHGFVWDYHDMYAYLSQGTEMLFLVAFAFGRHSAAALVHFAFLCTLPLMMVCWGRRFGYWKAGFFAAVVVFVSPVIAKDGVSAYNDLAVVTILYAVFYLLQVWDDSSDDNLLVLIGLLAGAAYATKYTAFLAFPFALGCVLWWKRGAWRWSQVARLAVPAALLVAPWVIRNWLWLGNPVAPFFNSWFPNPYYHAGMERIYAEILRHYVGLKHSWQIPLELTLRGGITDGLFGPVFLLFPLTLFALRLKVGRRLLLAAVVFGLPAFLNVGSRFVISSAPFVALAIGITMAEIPGALPLLGLFQCLLCWPTAVSTYCTPWAWRIGSFPYEAAFRREPEQHFLEEHLSEYGLKAPVELDVPPGEKVFTFSGRPHAYFDREFVVSYQSTLGNLAQDILWAPQGHRPDHQFHFKFLPVSTRGIRVVNMSYSPDFWTVAELRLYTTGRELPRSPDWRLSAQPNGWEVQLAFDHSYATRWSTWQGMSPGDRIQVELPQRETVDEVVLECEPAWAARPQVEILLPTGRWVPITDTKEVVRVEPPEGIRRAAIRDLKALGFHFILVNPGDMPYQDMDKYPHHWGVTELAKVNGTRLYHLD
jgi:hypothetical protein